MYDYIHVMQYLTKGLAVHKYFLKIPIFNLKYKFLQSCLSKSKKL